MEEIEKYKIRLLEIEGVYAVGTGEGKIIVYVDERIKQLELPEPPQGFEIEIIKGKKIKAE